MQTSCIYSVQCCADLWPAGELPCFASEARDCTYMHFPSLSAELVGCFIPGGGADIDLDLWLGCAAEEAPWWLELIRISLDRAYMYLMSSALQVTCPPERTQFINCVGRYDMWSISSEARFEFFCLRVCTWI